MLIQQDVIRREMLHIKGDDPGNPTVETIKLLALHGKSIGYSVIVEGILQNKTNQNMLVDLLKSFDRTYVYYFDISFDETLKRHQSKPNAHEFGEDDMRRWWQEKDYLGTDGEKHITDRMSESDILEMILSDVQP